MHVHRLRAPLLGVLLAIHLGAAASAPSLTLHELIEQAWQRSAAGRSQPARALEAEATRELSASWLAGQPVLGLSQRSGRAGAGSRLSESEASVAAPLWTPSQRDARRVLAERVADDVQAQARQSRLEVAGEVRTRLWEAAAAQALLEEKQGHLIHTGELADEVKRRVGAGDLARVDALLAEQEVQAARVAVEQARAEARAGVARLTVLTGYAGPLPLTPEPVAAAAADHAAVQAARAAEQRAKATLRAARVGRSAPPTVLLSVRRERDAGLAAPERSLGVAVQIPLGGAGRNRPLEAQAQAQIAAASAEVELAAVAARTGLDLARANLETARLALDAARARVDAMSEHRQLIERAFRLGERGLAELLRSNALMHEAEVAQRQQEIALARAHAQVNQASGVLP